MKKWKKALLSVAAGLVAAALIVLCILYPPADNKSRYLNKIQSIDFLENELDDAIAQTEIYNIVKEHFESELPEGKTDKKAIVIGYDGCRLDALTAVRSVDGAMNHIIENGGKAYIAYCGGVKYPAKNTQDTSTAPGWCSILTGQWADVHGITGNYIVKSNDHLTLLTTLVEDKVIDDSAFYVSWAGHFTKENSTYSLEAEYIKEHDLAVNFTRASGDDGTREAVFADLEQENCSDFIFTILEYCDHAGHSRGFYTGRKSYQTAFSDADKCALDIITQVKSRENYENEDWLIVLTADHGGIGLAHGGRSIQERHTFIFTNKTL